MSWPVTITCDAGSHTQVDVGSVQRIEGRWWPVPYLERRTGKRRPSPLLIGSRGARPGEDRWRWRCRRCQDTVVGRDDKVQEMFEVFVGRGVFSVSLTDLASILSKQ